MIRKNIDEDFPRIDKTARDFANDVIMTNLYLGKGYKKRI